MADLVTTLGQLEKRINAAAEADAKNILADAEKRAEAMINEENERSEKEHGSALNVRVSKYRSAERKRVSEKKYAADRKVLLHRNELVDGLFGEIRKEIGEFTASGDYAAHLEKCVKAADSREKLDASATVYCRKADLDAVGKLAGPYGVKVETDRNIVLGGLIFKYPEKGIYIDLTLDTAFESERGAFAARSEMQL